MPKSAAQKPSSAEPHGALLHPRYLETAMQHALAALSDVDAAYGRERAALEKEAGADERRRRLAQELEERHLKARAPHVQHLAALHQRLMGLTIFPPARVLH